MPTRKPSRPGLSPIALTLIAFGGLALVLAGVTMILLRRPTPMNASSVARAIHLVALAGNEPDAPPEAGRIGPWRISAAHVDGTTGDLTGFHLRCGETLVSASRARVHVDPETDSFSFEMWDLVWVTLPKTNSNGSASVRELEHYILGPAPFGRSIVADRGEAVRLPAMPGARVDGSR